jgi:hypothetical protein
VCTSFVIYTDKTYIGMNFDSPPSIDFRIILNQDSQFLVVANHGGRYWPSFGINDEGTFINHLLVDRCEKGDYRRGSNVVHTTRLIELVLGKGVQPEELAGFLAQKEIVNVPNYSAHCMIAARGRHAFIVEPGRRNIAMQSLNEDFLVLTNFAVADFLGQQYEVVTGAGSDRYRAAYEILRGARGGFTRDTGIAILRTTKQVAGDYPTQFSMLAIPEDNAVEFFIDGAFDRSFQFSFQDHQIRTGFGFQEHRQIPLTQKGITTKELAAW